MTYLITNKGQTVTTPYSPAEWQCMEAEGLVRPLIDGVWAAGALRQTADIRARAAGLVTPIQLIGRVVIGWSSAAWVHGWAPSPARLELLIDQSSRTTSAHRITDKVIIHEVKNPLDRSLNMSGTFVSDRVRTAVDVARYCNDDEAAAILSHAFRDPSLPAQIQAAEELGSLPALTGPTSRARRRLRKAAQGAWRPRAGSRGVKAASGR
ncbi:hypothetical protein [Falsarthrobacter nasiphocae]|uniref:AbiEi antitoxin C-terminal domain-containing protein n=1 Tax=Falsarthrobacter nasiphocae TaxID=189863 RepID=A0AAE3YIV6_9MICC|nr:hypothetical protein [Falsarthrobacter nasiphocae]MDR6892969.1 hypothetical protein [Falsarthrobacter nasiphocae]